MPIETIIFQGMEYPAFQAEGNATQFILPYAKKLLKGRGFDIGFGRNDWALGMGSIPIDIKPGVGLQGYHAMKLPKKELPVDYIFCSHSLEHLPDWVAAIEYFASCLTVGGVLFLYLPHEEQRYWRPFVNRKHKHWLTARMVSSCMREFGFIKTFSSERDLNWSFAVVGEKGEKRPDGSLNNTYNKSQVEE